MVSRRRKT